MIGEAFTIQNASDYDDIFFASKTDTEAQIANAEYIYKLLYGYIQPAITYKSLEKEHS